MAVEMYSSKLCAKNNFLTFEYYKYGYHKQLKNEIQRWKCTDKTCPSFFKMDKNGIIITKPTVHTHPPEDECLFKRQMINNWTKREAIKNPTMKPEEIIIYGETEFNCHINYIDKKCIVKNIYHARTHSKSQQNKDV